MKDIRISIRLNNEEHIKFKMLSIKKQKSMQELLKEYVLKEISKSEKEVKNEKKT